jgi:dUTP pyrophosphatase
MEGVRVFITKRGDVSLPAYATAASSGMDLRAHLDRPVVLQPMERSLVPTGISVAIPPGFEAEVRPRSGLAANFGITVLNTPGTIDADYRGEIKVILINLSASPFEVRNGDRVAQIVFRSVARVEWEAVDSLPESGRGEGGFGSTGRR